MPPLSLYAVFAVALDGEDIRTLQPLHKAHVYDAPLALPIDAEDIGRMYLHVPCFPFVICP